MINTLKTLSTLIVDDMMKMTLEEIAVAYREDLDPSLLATAFAKTYKLILKVSEKYYGLTEDDIASLALEKLDYCLQTHDSQVAAFSTYYTTHLINRFREETQSLNTHKRKIIFHSDSYEALVENGFDIEDNTSIDETLDNIESYGLNDREVEYCNLILQNYTNAEIAKQLGVSVMTLSNMRKKLREKLMPLALQY